ncbi:MAG: hypothetical protein JWN32_3090 [Solirubrobacterales bacterium]|nr:hypothetical protein [Solirubrobacterales bacterium]
MPDHPVGAHDPEVDWFDVPARLERRRHPVAGVGVRPREAVPIDHDRSIRRAVQDGVAQPGSG